MNIVLALLIGAHLYLAWLVYQAYEADSVRIRKRRRRRR